jgi:hydrogenase-4 component B
MMWLFVAGVMVLFFGAIVSLLARRVPGLASTIGSVTAIAGSFLALASAARVLYTGLPVSVSIPWQVPLGRLSLAVDPLSAVFILPIAVIVAVAAFYGVQYMHGSYRPAAIGPSWFFFNLLAATMLLVVTSRNGLLFLMCWEAMSLASFFLVVTDHEQGSVRRAGWIYLAAMHLGTACLLVLFLLLGRSSGTLDFDRFTCEPGLAGMLFILAVVGFGTKAGFIPVHVWLPEAHPAAPSHVSAVMSGVMIKTGIYGLLRILTFLPEATSWWGWTLIAVGAVSGVLGVLSALAQHDLKRLLAYHSVENIGIISLGMGVGLLGIAYRIPVMAFMGFAGALLHVLNHALFKSLLFLGAGAVQHGTGTRDIDRLGGLLKAMPVTGGTFLVGACAISGLPPLNGFVSELLIYVGVLLGVASRGATGGVGWAPLCVFVVGGLALIGGLATACFTKAFGCVFLGEPRSDQARGAHEVGAAMRASMLVLAGACFLVALTAPIWPYVYRSAIATILPVSLHDTLRDAVAQTWTPLIVVCVSSWALLGAAGLVAAVRLRLLSGRQVERGPTWDCGYAAPTPRMQYTASSFACPLLLLSRTFLRPRISLQPPTGLFPKQARFESETPDVFLEYLFRPVFTGTAWGASKLRWLQHGRIQLYVLYIALTILVLLVWKLG